MGGARELRSVQAADPQGRPRSTRFADRAGRRTGAMAIVAVAILAVSTVVLLPPPALAAPVDPAADAATDAPLDPAADPVTGVPDLVAAAGPPAQTQAAPNCVTNQPWGWPLSVSCTYTYEGGLQWWSRPAEVGRVSVVVNGAQGGNSTSAGGGNP